jgi:hypothetical protein
MENNDWKILLPQVGIGLLCAGVPIMVMEQGPYFIAGLIITMVGFFLIASANFIKSNDQTFWDFIDKATKFALEKSIVDIDKHPEEFNQSILANFNSDLSNAIACFYKIERAEQLQKEIYELCDSFKSLNSLDGRDTLHLTKNAYRALNTYLKLFYNFKDHSVHHSPNFKPSELKRYLRFLGGYV